MASRAVERSIIATSSRVIDRPKLRERTCNRGCQRGGQGRGIEMGTTAWSKGSTGIDMPGNPEEQCQGFRSLTMHTTTPTPDDIAALLDTANVASRCEASRKEVSAEQVKTDLTGARSERDYLIREVNGEKRERSHYGGGL